MDWGTRALPRTDRIVCLWLIRRFAHPAAAVQYVHESDAVEVAAAWNGYWLDSLGSAARMADRR